MLGRRWLGGKQLGQDEYVSLSPIDLFDMQMTWPFAIIAVLTLASAVAAMSLRNLVHCALALAVTFAGLAAFYLQLGRPIRRLRANPGLCRRGGDPDRVRHPADARRRAVPASRGSPRTWVVGVGVAVAVFGVLGGLILSSRAVTRELRPPPEATVRQIGDQLMTRYHPAARSHRPAADGRADRRGDHRHAREGDANDSACVCYLLLSALLFAIGLAGALTRRNAIIVLIGIELMLNAANLNFIAFWRYGPNPQALTGHHVRALLDRRRRGGSGGRAGADHRDLPALPDDQPGPRLTR